MERGGPRTRGNGRRVRQAPSRSSGVGFLWVRGNTKQAHRVSRAMHPGSGMT